MLDDKNIEIFSSRDKIRNQMLEVAKKYMELESIDFSKTSYMSYLIDILSIMTSNLMFYNSSIYKEFFTTKAIQRESILNLAATLGYSPPLASPSSVDVLFSIPLTFTNLPVSFTLDGLSSVKISPKYFKCYTADDIPFTLENTITVEVVSTGGNIIPTVREFLGSSDLLESGEVATTSRIIPSRIENGELQFTASFKQSVKFKNTYSIPQTDPYEFYNFDVFLTETGYLEDVDIAVKTIDSNQQEIIQEWESYDSLYLIPSTEYGFYYRQIDGGIRIFFGNGVIGRKPSPNSEIEVEFSVTRGTSGNVIAGSILKADRVSITEYLPETQSSRLRPVKMSVINITPATGGTDIPTIDEIRSEALKNVVTNKRLVSSTDYSNISTLGDILPINNLIHVLKRSDIKRNEISLFTELFFENNTVPTRNEVITVDTTTSSKILQGTEYILDGIKYLNIFDIDIDTNEIKSDYYYNVQELSKAVTIQTIEIDDNENKTRVYPTYVEFLLNKNPDPDIDDEPYEMEITLNYIYLDADQTTPTTSNTPPSDPEDGDTYIVGSAPTGVWENYSGQQAVWSDTYDTWIFTEITRLDLDTLTAKIVPEWASFSFEQPTMETHEYYEFDDSSENIYRFKHAISLSSIPYGEQKISFTIWDKDPDENSTAVKLAECYVIVSLRSNLNNYMYSQVQKVDPDDENDKNYKVYDVPLIRKKYWDNIDKNTFILQVMNKLTNFNVNDYKMLTDFVNLKFSNTTGYSDNMKFNKTTKKVVNVVNPEEMPTFPTTEEQVLSIWVPGENSDSLPTSPSNGDKYLAGDTLAPWSINYIYEWNSSEEEWTETVPEKYDLIWVEDIEKFYMFDGSTWNVHSYRAAFSMDRNPWDSAPYSKTGGKIAHWSYEEEDWIFENLRTNDIFYNLADETVYIYNGNTLLEPRFELPIQIQVAVWPTDTKSNTFQSLTDSIKNKLVDELFSKFGYDKPLYISNITKIVQSVAGVKHCQVLKPTHDIFFTFNIYDDMTQQQLLEYTPDLIYFTTNDITVDIRNY